MGRTSSRFLKCLGLLVVGAALAWAFVPRIAPTISGSHAIPSYDGEGAPIADLPRPARLPNLLLVVLDTVRGDVVTRETMPYLASVGDSGVRCTNVSSTAPWTLPALSSLMTGLLPGEHRADDVNRAPFLPSSLTTFAEILSRTYGYETAAFYQPTWFGGREDLLQGFQTARPYFTLWESEAILSQWLLTRDRSRPCFLLLHSLEAHEPYGAANHAKFPPGQETAHLRADATKSMEAMGRAFHMDMALRAVLNARPEVQFGAHVTTFIETGWKEVGGQAIADEFRSAYLDGVSWVDRNLGNTITNLERHGLLDGGLLAVVGDHGEAFGEHGILNHGRHLYDELVRIPCVLRGPGPFRGGREVTGSFGLVDVLPTFLDWAGMAPLQGIEGRSALAVVKGESRGWPVTSQVNPRSSPERRSAVRTDRWKWIGTYDPMQRSVSEEMYDLQADPREQSNLFAGDDDLLALEDPAFAQAVARARQDLMGDAATDPEAPVGAVPPHLGAFGGR